MMPRIRTVKPELFKHETLFEAEIACQLPLRIAFIALFSCCDRAGRFRWRSQRLKIDMLPYDDVDMAEVLDALVTHGFIKKYKCEGEWYGCIPSWSRHQYINQREAESDIPPLIEGVIGEKQSMGVRTIANDNLPLNNTCFVNEPLLLDTAITDDGLAECHPIQESKSSLGDSLQTNFQKMQHEVILAQSLNSRTEDFTERFNINKKIMVEPQAIRMASLIPPVPLNEVSRACTCALQPCTCGRERKGTEREVEGNNTIVASKTRSSLEQPIAQVFEHWKTMMAHPHAKLDPKRKALISKALNFGYDVQALCQAITGCSMTPHNIGDNDRGQRYDGLHVILRDSDQIDRFMHNYHYPPRPISEAERKTRANVQSLQRWVNKKIEERF